MFDTLISTADLAARLDDPSLVIVDVRHDLAHPDRWGEAQYARGPSAGAHASRTSIATCRRPRPGATAAIRCRRPSARRELFGRLGIDATKQVVAYDQGNGMFAARLWWMLRWLGHDAVAVLDGGYARWTCRGSPGHDRRRRRSRRRASRSARVHPTVSATGVAASLPRHTLLLLDARAAERFRGDTEPLDPVAGHIPGAMNRPYARNVNADGTFRSARELRGEFEAMLHGRPVEDVVHYCGSGVSAAATTCSRWPSPATRSRACIRARGANGSPSRARPVATGGV